MGSLPDRREQPLAQARENLQEQFEDGVQSSGLVNQISSAGAQEPLRASGRAAAGGGIRMEDQRREIEMNDQDVPERSGNAHVMQPMAAAQASLDVADGQ